MEAIEKMKCEFEEALRPPGKIERAPEPGAVDFYERAAVAQFDGGLPRECAEGLARTERGRTRDRM